MAVPQRILGFAPQETAAPQDFKHKLVNPMATKAVMTARILPSACLALLGSETRAQQRWPSQYGVSGAVKSVFRCDANCTSIQLRMERLDLVGYSNPYGLRDVLSRTLVWSMVRFHCVPVGHAFASDLRNLESS